MNWQTSRYLIDLTRPRVMGIVNVTPDSFFDGGVRASDAQAIAHCERLVRDGAHLLDIGGESSRPGADPLTFDEEWRRIGRVLAAAVTLGVPVSVDTYRPQTMRAALDLGVDIVNDIAALRREGAVEVVAAHPRCGVCLMHMRGEPASMQSRPFSEGDVVTEVADFLAGRVAMVHGAGVALDRIVLDPGYGFGKSVEQNFELLARQSELGRLGRPLLAGLSRKSLGAVTGRDSGDRLAASLAAALAAVQGGARIVRVHDVAETVDALEIWRAARVGAAGG
jgi:dihydropteroate synthase